MDRYTQNEIDPWANSLRGIGQALLQMPAMRAQIAQRQQQGRLLDAQTEHANAETQTAREHGGLYRAQTADVEEGTSSGRRLAEALRKVATDPNDTNAVGDSLAELGHYFKKNPQEAANGFRTMLTTLTAHANPNADPRQLAALNGDADKLAVADAGNDSREKMAGERNALAERLANNRKFSVAPGAAVFNSATGKPIYHNPSAAADGEQYQTEVTEIPAVTPQPEIPPTPEVRHWFKPNEPAIPGQPAVPGQPARKITRRVLIPKQAAPPIAAPIESGTNAAPAQGAASGKVLTKDIAALYLQNYGNRQAAEAAARADGFAW